MAYTVGGWWLLGYLVLAAIAGIVAIAMWDRGSKGWWIPLILVALFLFFGGYAGTHFRVKVNERALLINSVKQEIVGVRESGVQSRPLFGIKVQPWPANTQYEQYVDMGPSVDSATTKNGTAIYADTRVYLDLSAMDIEGAYRASNGNWETFYEKNLRPGMMAVARSIASQYATAEHTFRRSEWEADYEKALTEYLSDPQKGFGIKLLQGRSILNWDFVNDADAKAFDDANNAVYLIQQRENEKAALLIEAEMAKIRSEMLSSTADGTISGLESIAIFIGQQPSELRPYLMTYLGTMVDLEYLRLVGEQRPEQFLPPGSSALPTYNVGEKTTLAEPMAVTE